MIPAAQRIVFICAPCCRALDPKLGKATTASALAAAAVHGCLLHDKPTGAKYRLWRKFHLPRSGTGEEWRKIWDSLDGGKNQLASCRHGCGHAELVHYFSPAVQDHCGVNCPRCAS